MEDYKLEFEKVQSEYKTMRIAMMKMDREFKFRSPYILKSFATDVIRIFSNWVDMSNEDLRNIFYSLKGDLEIFIADLTGELKHDYEKRLKRYPNKWDSQQSKVLEIISIHNIMFNELIEKL